MIENLNILASRYVSSYREKPENKFTSHFLLDLFLLDHICSPEQGENDARLKFAHFKFHPCLGDMDLYSDIYAVIWRYMFSMAQLVGSYWCINQAVSWEATPASMTFWHKWLFSWNFIVTEFTNQHALCQGRSSDVREGDIKYSPESWRQQQWREPCHCPPSRGSRTGPSGRQKPPYSPENSRFRFLKLTCDR